MKTMVEVPDGLFPELGDYFPLQGCNGDLVMVRITSLLPFVRVMTVRCSNKFSSAGLV
jgi:hypothetical protein